MNMSYSSIYMPQFRPSTRHEAAPFHYFGTILRPTNKTISEFLVPAITVKILDVMLTWSGDIAYPGYVWGLLYFLDSFVLIIGL